MYLAKLASGAAITAMVLAGGSVAFAQTTGTTGTGTTGYTVNSTTSTTGTGATSTGTTNTTSTGTTGSTSTGGTTGTTSTTPGIPNTGAGGDAATNIALLGISALALVGGGAYLARQRFAR
jgi:hypothetical protein